MNNCCLILFLLIISSVLGFKEEIEISNVCFEELLRLSKRHDLAHIVYYELTKRNCAIDDPIKQKFKKQYEIALYRDAVRCLTLKYLKELFCQIQIPFISLKGSGMIDNYPQSWMRTSADIDILVKKEDIRTVERKLVESGFVKTGEGSHDISFVKNGFSHIELHHTLIEDYVLPDASKMLSKAWDYAIPKDDTGIEFVLPGELDYLYHIAHMAKHFVHGGCGIRSVLDQYILKNKYKYLEQVINKYLKSSGLDVFEEKINELSQVWFGNRNMTSDLEQLSEFVINGGLYGSSKQGTAVKRISQSRTRYYIERIFQPYNTMKQQYRVLTRIPILLPLFWIIRWFKLVNKKVFKNAKKEIQTEKSINNEYVNKTGFLLAFLGLNNERKQREYEKG